MNFKGNISEGWKDVTTAHIDKFQIGETLHGASLHVPDMILHNFSLNAL